MNQDIFTGMWKQIKGEIKTQWGKLTDDELDQVEGQYDKMIGKLQEKYGYTRQEAEDEMGEFLRQYAR
ncbi:MAG: CsbD family protein [Anaerolineae bacterium]|nr:CsbD family protein [Anaerolineae bacterium]